MGLRSVYMDMACTFQATKKMSFLNNKIIIKAKFWYFLIVRVLPTTLQ